MIKVGDQYRVVESQNTKFLDGEIVLVLDEYENDSYLAIDSWGDKSVVFSDQLETTPVKNEMEDDEDDEDVINNDIMLEAINEITSILGLIRSYLIIEGFESEEAFEIVKTVVEKII